MKIDLTVKLTDLRGKPISLGLDTPEATLGDALEFCVVHALPGDEHMDAAKKLNVYRVAKLLMNETADLPVESIALLKERVAKAFTPVVVGRVFDLIDPQTEQ